MVTDTVKTSDRELVISRVINAPRELVWEVWTNPEHIKHWWGPNGFTNTIFQMDVKPGGVWDFIMHGPDGTDFKNKSIYKEVVKPEKLVYDHVSGPKFRSTVTFTEQGQRTLVSIQMLFETAEERNNTVKTFKADEGLRQNIDKLEAYLQKLSPERELTITRIMNAPREMVFNAWINPDQLKKWWGPKGFANPVCKIDPTPGGAIYIDMKGPDGTVYPMDGEFHEIVKPERIVLTTAALDKDGKRLFEVVNTVTFAEENGKTKLTLHAAVFNVRDEGRPYLDGMNEGWSQTIDRLDEYVTNSSKNKPTEISAPIIIERTFNAPVEKVWEALTDIDQMKQWYFPQLENFKPEEGFETEFNVHHEGKDYYHIWKINKVVPLKKISVEWKYKGYPGNSLVIFELFPQGDRTRLVLTHEKIETFNPEKYPELAPKNFMEGWTAFMDKALKEFLEK